uniref:Uncharacterized protein n=1 Tax=Tanacetum cinerariifolium TaxID=118510 RepID=A0A6L2K928_TANCI|nr:hypothetical protein [Tanacetum cinerariifolium]
MNMGQDRQMQIVGGNGGNQFRQYAGQNVGNTTGYNDVIKNQIENGSLVAARAEGNAAGQNGIQIRCYNCRGVEEYDLMVATADLDEIKEVNANCILMSNLQQASTSGTQTDSTLIYDTDGSAEVHENCDDNKIFNMFTQEEQYTKLLEPIPESHQVPQNDNDVISEDTSVEQGGETVEQHSASFEETRALYESLYQNLAIKVEKVNSVNRKLKETNADMTTELARYKNQERCFEISQEKYDKLERCYQQSVYQEQCLSKKINALHASSAHQELHKIVREEIFPIVNQVDARVQNFELQFLKKAAKFVGDFKSLANEADASLAKHKALELEIKRLLKAVISQDIMTIVKNASVIDTLVLQTELERTKERFEKYIIKKESEYAKLWNDWYKKYTRNPLSQKLKNENVELEFQILNYARENAHLKATYKNLFDSISVSRAQTKTIITSLQNELQSNIYKNAKLRTQLFKKVYDQKDNTQDTSKNTKFAKKLTMENLPKVGMFTINPSKTSREEKHVPNTVSASARTKPITILQPPVITKKDVNSDSNGLSSTRVNNTKTRRPQPRSNTKNDRVPSASKSSQSQNKEAKVEKHHRNLLLSKNNKHISSKCNNIKIDSQDVISKVVCAMCKKCLISINHDKCLSNSVNGKNSCGKNQKAKVSVKKIQKKYQPKVTKLKKLGTRESLATPKPRKSRLLLRWSPTGKIFDKDGKIVDSSESKSQFICFNDLFMVCRFGLSKHMTGNLKLLINFVWKFMGTIRFGNDHVAAILGFGNLQNACFVRNLEGVDLLKGDRSTNLYTINLYGMASASPICLMDRASSTKSWLWHQRLSHLNFDTINDLARNDLVAGLPKFKYHKERLCPSYEQGKSKRASHLPKPVPNSRQRLNLLHMDLCGPMRIASINGKRYVLVIVDDYSRCTWVHFLRSKDEAPELIIKFLKRISVLLQSPNDHEDIGKLGAKGDIVFFIGYSADSCAYRVYNRRTKKIMKSINVSFDELLAMAFEQRSSKPELNSMTSGHISSGLDLTYAPSTITTQQPSEGELDLLFEALYDDYIGGQPSATARTIPPAQEPQVHQTSTASITIADTVPILTNSSSLATNILITSQDVDELNPNAMVDGNTFVNPFANSSTSATASSSQQNMDPSNIHTFYQPYPYEF